MPNLRQQDGEGSLEMQRVIVAGGLSIGMTVSTGDGPEDPNAQASCVGLIAADHARRIPHGTHISKIVHGVKTDTDASRISPGTFIGSVAQQHLGSHTVSGSE